MNQYENRQSKLILRNKMQYDQLEEYYFGFPVNRQDHLHNQKMFRTELSQEKLSERSNNKNHQKLHSLKLKYVKSSSNLNQKTKSKSKKDTIACSKQKYKGRGNFNFISQNKVHIQYILRNEVLNKKSAVIKAQQRARQAYLNGQNHETIQLPQQSKQFSQYYIQTSKYASNNNEKQRKSSNYIQNPQKSYSVAVLKRSNENNIEPKNGIPNIIINKSIEPSMQQMKLFHGQDSQQILPKKLQKSHSGFFQRQVNLYNKKQQGIINVNNMKQKLEDQAISIKNDRKLSFDDQVLRSFKQDHRHIHNTKNKINHGKIQQQNSNMNIESISKKNTEFININQANFNNVRKQTGQDKDGLHFLKSKSQLKSKFQQNIADSQNLNMQNQATYLASHILKTKEKQFRNSQTQKLHVKSNPISKANIIEDGINSVGRQSQVKKKHRAIRLKKKRSQHSLRGQLSLNSIQYVASVSPSNKSGQKIQSYLKRNQNKESMLQKLRLSGAKLRPTQLVNNYVKRSGGKDLNTIPSFKIHHVQLPLNSRFSLSQSIKEWSEFQQHRKIHWRQNFDADSDLEQLISNFQLHLILVNQIAQFVVLSNQIYVEEEASWRYLLNFLTYKAFYHQRMRISKCLKGQLKEKGKKVSCFTLTECEVRVEDIQKYIGSPEIVERQKDIEETNKVIWKSLSGFYRHLNALNINNNLFNLEAFNQKDLRALFIDINDQLQTLLTKFQELNSKQDEEIKEVIAYRAFKIIEITLLISQFQGRLIKQYEQGIEIGYFDQYFNENYPKFKDTILHFTQGKF